MSDVLSMYSLIMLSLEQSLLFFTDLMHFKISVSVIVEFKISSLSFSHMFKSSILTFSKGAVAREKGPEYCAVSGPLFYDNELSK